MNFDKEILNKTLTLIRCFFLFMQTSMNVRLWAAPVSLVEHVTTLMGLTTASVHHIGEVTTVKSVSMLTVFIMI